MDREGTKIKLLDNNCLRDHFGDKVPWKGTSAERMKPDNRCPVCNSFFGGEAGDPVIVCSNEKCRFKMQLHRNLKLIP